MDEQHLDTRGACTPGPTTVPHEVRRPRTRNFTELELATSKLFNRPSDVARELAEFARLHRRLARMQDFATADATIGEIAARYREIYRDRIRGRRVRR